MNDANLKTWWSRELAEHLDIGGSTLRKWSLELEKAGYVFLRDEHGRRAYVEHDALALRQFKKYLDGGMSYDSASKAVTTAYLRRDSAEITLSAKLDFPQEQRDDERYEVLEAKIEAQSEQLDQMSEAMVKLIEMNKELYIRLDEFATQNRQLTELVTAQKAIAAGNDSRQEEIERKRDEQGMQLLHEIRETKQLAGRSVWSRIFGGK